MKLPVLMSQKKPLESSEQIIGNPSLDNILVKKRKSDAIDCIAFLSQKISKRNGGGQSFVGTKSSNKFMHDVSDHGTLDSNSIMTFITLWKDKCKTAPEAMKQMLMFHKPDCSEIPIEVAQQMYTSYPLVGLINVAISWSFT
ncbi:hypothetical protein CTI12_AA606090 [Artemisia annua]|uniref:Uncharacterized protein n=1 Tax=Artemisia annua TaxID=35608 RepID=A0A2U1KGQ0_ARTAN|nr:hypothetical protein CTI12_AA606090 [Artemisia annua]